MYSPNNHTKAISARLAAGLTERIDYECEIANLGKHTEWGDAKWNRNRFINEAAELLLHLRYSMRCGNLSINDVPAAMRPYLWMLQ